MLNSLEARIKSTRFIKRHIMLNKINPEVTLKYPKNLMKFIKVIVYFQENDNDELNYPCNLKNTFNGDNNYHRYVFTCLPYNGYSYTWNFQILMDENTKDNIEVCHVHP